MLFAMRDDPRLDVQVAGIPILRLSGLDKANAVASLGPCEPANQDVDRPQLLLDSPAWAQ
jgi:hypothetical protein